MSDPRPHTVYRERYDVQYLNSRYYRKNHISSLNTPCAGRGASSVQSCNCPILFEFARQLLGRSTCTRKFKAALQNNLHCYHAPEQPIDARIYHAHDFVHHLCQMTCVGRGVGGVSIILRESAPYQVLLKYTSPSLQMVAINMRGINFVGIYIGPTEPAEQAIARLEELATKITGKTIILCNFNARQRLGHPVQHEGSSNTKIG